MLVTRSVLGLERGLVWAWVQASAAVWVRASVPVWEAPALARGLESLSRTRQIRRN